MFEFLCGLSLNAWVYVVDHLPEFGEEGGGSNVEVLEDCQDVVIRWFTTFVQAARKVGHADQHRYVTDTVLNIQFPFVYMNNRKNSTMKATEEHFSLVTNHFYILSDFLDVDLYFVSLNL